MNLTIYIFLFFLFSFIGFLYESFVYYYKFHHFKKIGPLQGPYVLLYGIGGCIFHLLPSIHLCLYIGVPLLCLLELISSYILDYYHIKRWDYSNYIYSYQGRICLYSIELFTLLGMLYNMYVRTPLLLFLFSLPNGLLLFLDIIFVIILAIDIRMWINYH